MAGGAEGAGVSWRGVTGADGADVMEGSDVGIAM